LMGEFRLELVTMGDAFRLLGLLGTIALSSCEALGFSILRRLGILENWRRATAFWVIVMLLHIGIPMRQTNADANPATKPWADIVLVIPISVAMILEALAPRQRRHMKSDPPRDDSADAHFPVSWILRRLWMVTRPLHDRELCDIERRCALAPPHAC